MTKSEQDVVERRNLRENASRAAGAADRLRVRRGEAVELTLEHLQQRDGRWVIVDLRGKHGRLRSIAVAGWVKQAVDCGRRGPE
jgi:hypothetical protein